MEKNRMNEYDILQRALNGDLSERDAIEHLDSVCDDDELIREIVEKVASASVMGRGVRVAWSLVDWLKGKCRGNNALMAGAIALMLSSGTLSAHVVQEGDTLWRLGGGTKKGVENVLALNSGLTENTVLKPGMKIVLPNEPSVESGTYKVMKGDTMSGIAKKLGVSLKDLVSWNPQVKDVDRLAVGQELNTSKPADGGSKSDKPAQQKTDAKTDFVARVIYAESGNSVDEMEMIAHLIVNRMKSGMFPSGAYDVVRQKGQFSCATGTDGNVRWKNWSRDLNAMTKKAYELAEKVMKGDASGMKGKDSALFYCTKSLARNGVGKGSEGLAKDYGHPKGWGSYSTFTPVETSANHVFYECEKK